MAPRYVSPLRYPGGKARMAPYLASLIREQSIRPIAYAEPFAGGAGAALKLLVDEVVRNIHINDLAPGVAAFWRAVFQDTAGLIRAIEQAPVTIDEWHVQRAIFDHPEGHDDLTLGFATFFLNRCNRSGILSARPIGGLEQTGNWKIDARFNRAALAERVGIIGQYRRRVSVTQLDAKDFMSSIEGLGQKALAYVDPPYIVQGEDLYLDSLSYEDHAALAAHLAQTPVPWILTYDTAEQITDDLYRGYRAAQFSIAHTAQKQHIGSEYVVFSDNLQVPNLNVVARANAQWVAV
ncbi:DNA adenine methylase [Curtobacterium sp. 179-B 9B NHS]|uniref:DNA adenine methylase n=1 Tax=Curtobacterium sp. 179-B 9B NHS TaxID=3374293 RepID=UPI0038795A17